MKLRRKSDGLGGFSGVSNTLALGSRKRITYNKFHVLMFWFLLTFHCADKGHFCMSMILALQRNNEVYKHIHINYHCYTHVPSANLAFTKACLAILTISVLTIWIISILLLCGDVHLNPGPGSVGSSSDSSIVSAASRVDVLGNHLSILHLNIQSIIPKLDMIKAEADLHDILIFSESWLKPETPDENILITNFQTPFRNDRRGRPGGGVIVYVRDSLSCKRRTDLELRGIEAVWLELTLKSKKILVGGYYRPPNSNLAYFNLLEESIDRAYNTNIIDIFVLGDFNYNMTGNSNNKMKDLIQQYNFKQLITEPTHFTENSSSLIDLILARNTSNVLTSGVSDSFLPEQTRYHCPVVVLLKFLRPSFKSYKRHIWSYNLADYELFRTIITAQNLVDIVKSNEDINENVRHLTESISSAAKQSIPNKTVTVRPAEHPWITCKIKNHIRKRKRYYRKFKQTSNQLFWEKYKTLRNGIVSEIRKSKTNYFEKLDGILSAGKANEKLFWKTAKQVLNLDKTSSNIPTLIMNHEHAEDDANKAKMLNNFFISQSEVDDTNKTLPYIARAENSLDFIVISTQDVKDVLLNLNINKACGPDLLSPRLLKEGADILAEPLAFVFNQSLRQCYFPGLWKEANVSPIHKKDDKSLPTNYRPISLLSQMGKTMERCVHKRLYNYVMEYDQITPLQSGFRHGDSTNFQLLHTYHTFCKAVDSGKEVRAVFCDISKAFDRVWHKGLLHKLSGIGCSDHICKWFSSYLSGRRQRVVINGETSDWASIYAGVPQGSILGPLLFLIYINDIVKHIGSSIRLFADDTSLYIVVESPDTAAGVINADLSTISKWAEDWLVKFNAEKTISVLISRKLTPVQHPPLYMDGSILVERDSHKHLGLTLSSSCSWTEHIDNISKKAWTRLNLLRSLKFRIGRQSLEQMYISFILPLLEYCDSVWDNASTESKKKIDTIHIEAARIITGATKLCSIPKLLSELGWDTLQSRRNKHKLVTFYKIMHGLAPNYLFDLVPPLVQENTNYNLRNANNIQLFASNTNLFYHSFFPSSVRAWNSLAEELKQASSVEAFKNLLNRHVIRPPKYYNAGTRIGQILHARLRMECSSLNSHLYHKNIVESPSCLCGGFESAYHFLFVCPRHTRARHEHLPPNLHNYSTRDLLFGCTSKTDKQNEDIFLKVQDFIINSGRF